MELLEGNGTATAAAPSSAVPRQRQIDIKKEIGKYIRKWPWFLLSMLLCYTAAKIYSRYLIPQYLTKTTLKLRQSKSTGATALNDLKTLGVGVSGDDEIQSEMTVLTSKPILAKVAKNLNLDVTFFNKGKIKEVEVYGRDLPLRGEIVTVKDSAAYFYNAYRLEPVGNNSYRLEDEKGNFIKQGRFGLPLPMPFGTVMLYAKPAARVSPLKVVFKSIGAAVGELEGAVSVASQQGKNLLLDVTMISPVPQKAEDILNELGVQYNIDGIKDKNSEAKNTASFIDSRLAVIGDDLAGIENQKENFKRQNQITDLEAQAGLALSTSEENAKDIVKNTMQLNLINSIYGESGGDNLLPTNMGLPAGVESAVSRYNDLLLTRNRVLKQATPQNPAVIEMNKQLASIKSLIRRSLLETRETLELQIAQANAQINTAKGNISRFPGLEKTARSIDRQQTLKEQLYLYLLQKREENAITLAVTAPKAKIVNPAYTTGIVRPNYAMITYGALATGFLLPLLFFVGSNVLDNRAYSKDDILDRIPGATVIAEIPENPDDDKLIKENDFSVFAESFRILTSNLKYFLKTKNTGPSSVIVVTSSVKGEGKTTIAVNTALTLAGKSRTIIVGGDIRNPQLHRFTDGYRDEGLTEFLVSDDLTPDRFIVRNQRLRNLDVLFSGGVAPNPNDLLDMDKFDHMIDYLKTRYEYIIIDSAPVMLVSDSVYLIENADVLLYVVKAGLTEKSMLDFASAFKNEHAISNMSYVINGVKPSDTRYGNKYGYGYYSYVHAEKPKWWKRFV